MFCFCKKATYTAWFPPVCLCHHRMSTQVAVKAFSRLQHVSKIKLKQKKGPRRVSLASFTKSGLHLYSPLKMADS